MEADEMRMSALRQSRVGDMNGASNEHLGSTSIASEALAP